MSWEAEWRLAQMPAIDEVERAATAVCAKAQVGIPRISQDEPGVIEMLFTVPVAGAEEIPFRLGTVLLRENVRRDLELPRQQHDERTDAFTRVPDHYRLGVSIVSFDDEDDEEDARTIVSVYSNELDNREGWPVVFELGLAIARHFGIEDDDDDGDDDDAPLLWDSSAVLTKK